ncbi:glycosyltransferase 87 family protein [Frondihabitans sp. 762G35]|uniref:glycosyltransferase 87 family protein n=1 Tax=Frondihabitans sp. 762G35 TaxID=1446794 RepID=UPI0013DB1ACA|nr:glycosyltransferase 87 family protein [Frondihabitans sp. 762G35]
MLVRSRRNRQGALRATWHRLRQEPRALWAGLVLIHVTVFLLALPMLLDGQLAGDLPVYSSWATEAVVGGLWPVFSFDWVYPAGAIVPVVLPRILGNDLYEVVWFVMIGAANAAALWALIRWGRKVRDQTAAGWWVLTVAILAPVDLLRLEGLTAPAVVVALLFLATRPRAAGLLLAAATWVKVWPAAVIVSIAVVSTKRWIVIAMGALVSAGVTLIVVLGGGGSSLASFVNAQNGRPLQLEAPLATPWVWMTMFRVPGASVFHDSHLVTEEVTGPGDRWLIENGTTVMLLVMAALVVLLAVATRRLAASVHPMGREVDLVLVGALSLATAFIVFNKVGSPQYMLWLTPIVAVGLVIRPPDWKVPAILLLVIAALTTIVFPSFYFALIALNPVVVTVLAARNVLLVVLLGWSVSKLGVAAFVHQPVPLGTRPLGAPVRNTSY